MGNMESIDYPICETLMNETSKHCVALVITEDLVKSEKGGRVFAQPSNELRNGTMTFVATGGKTYGITCWHVVKHYREFCKDKHPSTASMRTMVKGFHMVLDRFFRPEPDFGHPNLDIAIRELHPGFPLKIGKVAIDLDKAQKKSRSNQAWICSWFS